LCSVLGIERKQSKPDVVNFLPVSANLLPKHALTQHCHRDGKGREREGEREREREIERERERERDREREREREREKERKREREKERERERETRSRRLASGSLSSAQESYVPLNDTETIWTQT
jgi:hypothetical protein